MNQLYELSRQFPDEWIKPAPKGKFGNYIPHSVITQRLLEVCGPFNWEVVQLISVSYLFFLRCLSDALLNKENCACG